MLSFPFPLPLPGIVVVVVVGGGGGGGGGLGNPTLGFWLFCWGRRIWGCGWKRRAGSEADGEEEDFLAASESFMASSASWDTTGARDIEEEEESSLGSRRFA